MISPSLDMSPEHRGAQHVKERAELLALRRGLALVRDGRCIYALDRHGLQTALVTAERPDRAWRKALEVLEADVPPEGEKRP